MQISKTRLTGRDSAEVENGPIRGGNDGCGRINGADAVLELAAEEFRQARIILQVPIRRFVQIAIEGAGVQAENGFSGPDGKVSAGQPSPGT